MSGYDSLLCYILQWFPNLTRIKLNCFLMVHKALYHLVLISSFYFYIVYPFMFLPLPTFRKIYSILNTHSLNHSFWKMPITSVASKCLFILMTFAVCLTLAFFLMYPPSIKSSVLSSTSVFHGYSHEAVTLICTTAPG